METKLSKWLLAMLVLFDVGLILMVVGLVITILR